jgi:hypothetical protein
VTSAPKQKSRHADPAHRWGIVNAGRLTASSAAIRKSADSAVARTSTLALAAGLGNSSCGRPPEPEKLSASIARIGILQMKVQACTLLEKDYVQVCNFVKGIWF